MPRRSLQHAGPFVWHVMNRAIQGLTLFEQPADYHAFLGILATSARDHTVELFAYSVMPNHFHLVVRAAAGFELSLFMQTLTMTHAQQWRAETKTSGRGAVYQGRFRAVPVQEDGHFLRLVLYVERNPVRAGLVPRAEDWVWSSAWDFAHSPDPGRPALAPWPVTRPVEWRALLGRAGFPSIDARIRRSVRQGLPYGSIDWREGRFGALADTQSNGD